MSTARLILAGLIGFSALTGLNAAPAHAAVNGFGDQVASIDYFAQSAASGFDDPKDAVTIADSTSGAALNAIVPAAGGPASLPAHSSVPSASPAISAKPAGQ